VFHVEQAEHLPSLLKLYSAQIGILLDECQIDQFMTYLQQIKTWNETINLTSITDDKEIIVKHFLDSLAGLKVEVIRQGATVLDVGTGAGFPGVPLAIVRRDLEITLVERAIKKVSFLRSIVGLLRLQNVTIFPLSFENFIASEEARNRKFDYVVTRAIKPEILLGWVSKLLSPGGKCMLYSTKVLSRTLLGDNWNVSSELKFELPRGLGKRVISVVSQDKTL
jgi:16S rRNA (guanine527-N7)-methyltransferase